MGGPLGQVLRGHFECAKTSELGAGNWMVGTGSQRSSILCYMYTKITLCKQYFRSSQFDIQ